MSEEEEFIKDDIRRLEKQLSYELDDLLVAKDIELPRRIIRDFSITEEDDYDYDNGVHYTKLIINAQLETPPRITFKIEVSPNETEEPHFKVTYHGATCRFKIEDCSPMKAEAKNMPVPIKKIMKEIKECWQKNEQKFKDLWMSSRPTDHVLKHQNLR